MYMPFFIFHFLAAVVILTVVFNFCNSFTRRYPAVMFSLGIAVVVSGILFIHIVDIQVREFASIVEIHNKCKAALSENCEEWKDNLELLKKVLEFIYAAVGTGLIALAMDIRSEKLLAEK